MENTGPDIETINGKYYYVAYRGLPENLMNPHTKQVYRFDHFFDLKKSKLFGDSKIYGFTLSWSSINALFHGERVFKCLIPVNKNDEPEEEYPYKNSTIIVSEFYLTSSEIDFNEIWPESEQRSYTICAHRCNFNPHLFWDELNDLHILNLCSSGNENFDPHKVWHELNDGQINNLCHSTNTSFYPLEKKVWNSLDEHHKFALCLRGHPNFYPHLVWNELSIEQKHEVLRHARDNFNPLHVWKYMDFQMKRKATINHTKRLLKRGLTNLASKIKLK